MATDDLSEPEAREIMAKRKFMDVDELTWSASPDHGTQMVCSCNLVDEDGATIPGLTAELAFRVPARYDACKYNFTIFALKPSGQRRAYQLEVIPLIDRGHNGQDGDETCYGPHEHIGKLAQEVRVWHLDCRHHEQWFREFLSRSGTGYAGRYLGPFDGGLFTT